MIAFTAPFVPMRRLAAELWRHHRGDALVVLLLALLAPLIEALALLSLPGLGAAMTGSDTQRFNQALAVTTGLVILRAVLARARFVAGQGLTAAYGAGLTQRIAVSLAAGGWPRAARIGAARVQSLTGRDAAAATSGVHSLIDLVGAAALLVAQVTAALILSVKLTLVALVAMALVALLFWPSLRRARGLGHAWLEEGAGATAESMELIQRLKTALAEGESEAFLARHRARLDATMAAEMRLAVHQARAASRALVGGAVAAAMVAWTGVVLMAIPPVRMVALLAVLARMAGQGQALLATLASLGAQAEGLARIEATLGPLESPPPRMTGAAPLDWRTLQLDGVAIRHAGIDGLDLSLARGEWLALDAPSGTGKTSLVDIIAALMAPDAGTVRVDGEPLEARLDSWRAGLAYVGQDEPTAGASLRQALAAPGVDEAAMRMGLETVGLGPLLAAAGGDLDLPLGERGARLSGGERQRLALARALLRRPTLLILDEATGALDVAAERAVLAALRAALPDSAAILVAHRAETRALADRQQMFTVPAIRERNDG